MSGELAHSLDPLTVADLIAKHLAGRDRLRPVRDQLLGPAGRQDPDLGLLPGPRERGSRAVVRSSTGFPATRRVLEDRTTPHRRRRRPGRGPGRGRAAPPPPATSAWSCCRSSPRARRSASSSSSRASPAPIDPGPPRARPLDGQRGGDGARERAALRGRAQARRPRPPDRLLQSPVRPRTHRRGARPRAALRVAGQPADDRPRRLQARQRHVRPPVRRPGPRLVRRAHPLVAPAVRRRRPATAATSSR